jgi:hypothetical protein
MGQTSALEHDPEKLALGLDPMGGYRFSEKIMRHQRLIIIVMHLMM